MNFSPENQNFVAQYRNMLQQHRPAYVPAGLDPAPFHRASLAKLIGKSNTVIQNSATFPSNTKASPTVTDDGGSDGYEDTDRIDRRDSTGTNSNVSPGSVVSSGHEEEEDDSSHQSLPDNGKTPDARLNGSRHALSPVPEAENEEMRLSYSPKSEMSDSMDEDGGMEEEGDAMSLSYNSAVHHQLLHRKGSILQYCLTNPRAGGGSDAEAEHTSNSPGSSRSDVAGGMLQEDAFPGQLLQCEFCDFANSSRFHFNSHMNTHCVHRCPVPECNYSTRTEGRLRRHVKNHHDPSGLKDENDVDLMDEKPRGKKNSDAGSIGMSGSSSKMKAYKCKQCHDFLATNKNDYYDHQRMHIKPEKLLQCPLDGCRFVTEYKHHLEYHVRNHSGSKPFKCPNSNCNYTCVNKSMLNSHMKSHSSYYQHRCECGYVTKYTHSLKLHLNKYKHKAMNNGPESAQISMADSPQTPPAFQDAPKLDVEKPVKRRRNVNKLNVPQPPPPAPPPNMMGNGGGFHPFPMPHGNGHHIGEGGPMVMPGGFPYGMYGGVGGPMSQFHAASIYNNLLLSAAAANGMMPGMGMGRFVRTQETPERHVKRESPSPSGSDGHRDEPQDFSRDLSGRKQNGVLRMLPQTQSRPVRPANDMTTASPITNGASPLDLSGGKENGSDSRQSESPKSDGSSSNATGGLPSSRRRRKGPAFKLDLAVRQRLNGNVDDEETDQPTDLRAMDTAEDSSVVQPTGPGQGEVTAMSGAKSITNGTVNAASVKRDRRELVCSYCSMTFEDTTMYTHHMGFHSPDDPFTCKCGHHARDKVSFFLHIAKAPHY